MMKKRLGGLLTAALSLLFLLSSCTADAGIGQDTVPTESGTLPAVTVESVPPKLRTVSLDACGETAGENFGIYTGIPFSVADTSVCADGRLFCTSNPDDDGVTRLALLDLTDGTAVISSCAGEYTEDGWYSYRTPRLIGEHPLLFDPEERFLISYDLSLRECDRMELTEFSWYTSAKQTADGKLVISEYENPLLLFVSVGEDGTLSKESRTVPLPEGYSFSGIGGMLDETHLFVCAETQDYETQYWLYDLNTDALTPLYFEEDWYFFDVCGGNVVTYNYMRSEAELYPQNASGTKRVIRFPDDTMPSSVFLPENRCLYNIVTDSETGKLTVQCRSAETGKLTASVSPDIMGDAALYLAQEIGDTVLLTMYSYPEEEMRIFLWQPDARESAEPDVLFPMLTMETMHAKTEKLRAEMEAEYGIKLNLGRDAVRYFDGYAVVSCDNEESQYSMLKELETFFDALPEGFLRELNGCFDDGISLYFTGRILPDYRNRDSINDASAFTVTEGGQETIVFDITMWQPAKTIAHEFMHVIENAIYEKSWEEPDRIFELFARWNALNPEGFFYSGVYTDESGATLGYDDTSVLGTYYSEDGDASADDIYFVDGYATTYQTEDMARCFEMMFPTDGNELPAYFSGIHMREKASYLSACIRDAFDSITNDTVPVWERAADPSLDMAYFRDTYPFYEPSWENAAG